MMRKIISLLLAAVMLSSMMVTSFAYSDVDDSEYKNDIEELTLMGIVEAIHEDEFLPDFRMTRSEFCRIMVNTLNIQLNEDSVYFSDVPVEHKAFDQISYAASKGIMVGYGDGTFRPDQSITLGEALKVLTLFLGYQFKTVQYGTDLSSYALIAKELNLLKGLKLAYSDELTRGQACRLLNNALDVPIPVATGFGADTTYKISEDKTMLTEYLKMARGEALVESNSLISVQSKPLAKEGNIRIDGLEFRCQTTDQMDLVGYKVRYLYKLSEGDVKEMIYLSKTDNVEMTIDRVDFVSYNDNVITYLDEKEEEKKVKLSETADIFYNGQSVAFSKDMFEKVTEGCFRLVAADNSSVYTTVYIEEYEHFVIGSFSKTTHTLIDYANASKKLTLDPDQTEYVLIYDRNGNPTDFSAFKNMQSLSVLKNTDYIKVYINDASIQGSIDSIGDETIVIGDAEYELSGSAKTHQKLLNQSYEFYFDHFGRIHYLRTVAGIGNHYMYIVAVEPPKNMLNTNIKAQLFNTNTDALEVYEIATNLKINQQSYSNITIDVLEEALADAQGKIAQLVTVEFNEAGQIRALKTAKEISQYAEGEDGIAKTAEKTRYFLGDTAAAVNFEHEIYVSSKTKVLIVPRDPSSATEKDYKVGTVADYYTTPKTYNITAYYSSKDAEYADVILEKRNTTGNINVSYREHNSIVQKVTDSVDDNGDVVRKLYILNAGSEKVLTVLPSDNVTHNGKYLHKDVEAGDLIVTKLNSAGNVAAYHFVYDYSKDILNSPYDQFSPLSMDKTTKRTITGISPNFFTCSVEGHDDVKIYRPLLSVIIVKNNGGTIAVNQGDTDDIELGDDVLIQFLSRAPATVWVYKK